MMFTKYLPAALWFITASLVASPAACDASAQEDLGESSSKKYRLLCFAGQNVWSIETTETAVDEAGIWFVDAGTGKKTYTNLPCFAELE